MIIPKPFPFQEEGISYLRSHKRALLFDDMGLGKTMQAILALPEDRPAIVTCPAFVKTVWSREIQKFRPTLTPVILQGRNSYRRPNPGEVVILNPELLPKEPGWGLASETSVIADEVHMFKSNKADRTKAFRHLARGALSVGGSVWGLTGTPLMSHPPDLWGVLVSLDLEKEVFGRFSNFLSLFRATPKKFGGFYFKEPSPEVARRLGQVALGRKKKDVLPQLPSKVYEEFEIIGSDDAELKQFSDEFMQQALDRSIDSFKNGAKLAEARSKLATRKALLAMDFIRSIVEEEPVVIFSAHRAAAEVVSTSLNCPLVTGDVDSRRRSVVLEAFQNGAYPAIAGTIGAMGVGVTLTKARRVIFIDRDWTPSMNEQAEDRVCRIGQDRGVVVTDVVANGKLDKMVSRTLRRKQGIIDAAVWGPA